MNLSHEQLDALKELFLDLSKGLLLAALAVPVVVPASTFLNSLKVLSIGLISIYLTLKIVQWKEVMRK